MVKRSIVTTLLVLVMFMSCAYGHHVPDTSGDSPTSPSPTGNIYINRSIGTIISSGPTTESDGLTTEATEADDQLPPGVTFIGGQEPIPDTTTITTGTTESSENFFSGPGRFDFRRRFSFPHAGGLRFGWRYPINFWNTSGRARFGRTCLFGHRFGSFFYC